MYRRCPSGVQDARSSAFFKAYRWMDERGVLPAGRTLEDQAASFVEAVRILDAERSAIQSAKVNIDG
jgi:hypothetical protein